MRSAVALLALCSCTSPWERLPAATSYDVSSVAFADAHTGWIVTKFGGISKTADGGATWEMQRDNDLPIGAEPYPAEHSHFLIRCHDVHRAEVARLPLSEPFFLRTVDGGRKWERCDRVSLTGRHMRWTERLPVPGYARDVQFADKSRGWLLAHPLGHEYDGIRSWILTTSDGGFTWDVEVKSRQRLHQIAVAGDAAYACGEAGLVIRRKVPR